LKPVLYTIGYEGISVDEYINELIAAKVKLLVDVRNNPFSRKKGFSKKTLMIYCKNAGISYLHFPGLGIPSSLRKKENDLDRLFEYYQKTILTNNSADQDEICRLLETEKQIAITCFEANPAECHRKILAEALEERCAVNFIIRHL